jgi:hypothetical protein
MQRPRLPRPSLARGAILGIVTAVLLAFPLGVLAAHQFDDVPNDYLFHNDIDALVDSGVTSGCDSNSYCPNQFVTRGQMAAFLNRLGALQAGKTPVANARTSQSTDGFSLGCPSGTVWTSGICLETTPRAAATYFNASDTCAGLSGLLGSGPRWRLPLTGELRGARNLSAIALDAGGEWSDALYVNDDGNTFFSMTVFDDGGTDNEGTLSANVFRCATPPISFDLNLIIIPLEDQPKYPEPAGAPTQEVGPNGAPGS